jgi:vacuolar-type H+-ATPase subunit H
MEKIIQYLYDIEEKADLIVNRASEEKKRLNASLETNISEFNDFILKERNTKIELLKSRVQKELEEELSLLNKDCNQQINNMEHYFNEHHNELLNKVFNNIICD